MSATHHAKNSFRSYQEAEAQTVALTFRMDSDLHEQAKAIAAIDDMALSQVLRIALSEYVSTRKADPGFRSNLDKAIAALRELAKP